MIFLRRTIVILIVLYFLEVVAESPAFRVTAPKTICSESTNVSSARSEYSIISIEPESNTEFNLTWSIRWCILKSPTQRFTLMLWRKIRTLEKKLNKLKSKVFAIQDNELLSGVTYIFNVKGTSLNREYTTKTFSINYIQDQRVDIQEADLFSISLMGAQKAYVDTDLILEARVTTCEREEDYYYNWSVYNERTGLINISHTNGAGLRIPQGSLKPAAYEVHCRVLRRGDDALLTAAKSSFTVDFRGLKVHLSVDRLVVSTNTAFSVQALVENYDYFDKTVEYEWRCFHNGKRCSFVEVCNEHIFHFKSGISNEDEYIVSLTVGVSEQTATVNATLIALEIDLPVIELAPIKRVINENENVSLTATVYNVAPSCILFWYFATEEFLKRNVDAEHGEIIATTKSLTTYSLEEKFLDELADLTNETTIETETSILARDGRVRLVAECARVNDSKEIVYADVNVKMNRAPDIKKITIFPQSGTALTTLFRISAKATDVDTPLLYSFYCGVGSSSSLLLAQYQDHWTLDTFLPYNDGDTKVWVVVCDSFGACSRSDTLLIQLLQNNAIDIDMLLKRTRGHLKRCEVQEFQRVASSIIASFTNAGQSVAIFTRSLLESLPELRSCLSRSRYEEVLSQLAAVGLDTGLSLR